MYHPLHRIARPNCRCKEAYPHGQPMTHMDGRSLSVSVFVGQDYDRTATSHHRVARWLLRADSQLQLGRPKRGPFRKKNQGNFSPEKTRTQRVEMFSCAPSAQSQLPLSASKRHLFGFNRSQERKIVDLGCVLRHIAGTKTHQSRDL